MAVAISNNVIASVALLLDEEEERMKNVMSCLVNIFVLSCINEFDWLK